MHLKPDGHGRQLEDPGPDVGPATQKVFNPFTQDEPAGQGEQLLAPASEYDVPAQVEQLAALDPEAVPTAH